LVYVPDTRRGHLYGLDRILQVARELPEIRFELVGLVHGSVDAPPPNLRIYGRIPDLKEFFQRASVIWRPVRHDGLSHMVLEALGYGRHVMWTYPFPGCINVEEASDAQQQISRLHDLHRRGLLQVNWEGVEAISREYHPERLKKNILARLEQILNT
jgi:glycosyltransferase involved in cell wall biosynthesis